MSSSSRKLPKLKQINLFANNFITGDQDPSLGGLPRKSVTTRLGSRFGQCPLCEGLMPLYKLEMHAARCTGESTITTLGVTTTTGSTPNRCCSEVQGKSTSKRPSGEWSEIFCGSPLKKKARDDSKIFSVTKSITPIHDGVTKENLDMATNLSVPTVQTNMEGKKVSASIFNPIKSISNNIGHQDLPPGLFLYPDFISVEEEEQLLQLLDDPNELPGWKMGRFNGQHAGKRWGVHCNLRDRRVEAPEHPLPLQVQQIVFSKLAPLACWKVLASQRGPKFRSFRPNEANAIDYRRQRGDWLQAHVDDRKLSTEPIANLSLAGDCIMTFHDPQQHRTFRVHLPRRGLQLLTGLARYNYTHAIANSDLLSDRRVSITMRESPPTLVRTTTITTPTPRQETYSTTKR